MSKKTKTMGLERKKRQKERMKPLHEKQEIARLTDRIVSRENYIWKKSRKK